MELVAMDMKQRGMYIARQLSFHGVTFRIEEVPISSDFVKVYNDSVKLVSLNSILPIIIPLFFCSIHNCFSSQSYKYLKKNNRCPP